MGEASNKEYTVKFVDVSELYSKTEGPTEKQTEVP